MIQRKYLIEIKEKKIGWTDGIQDRLEARKKKLEYEAVALEIAKREQR
jgi:hypothetical protein